MHRRCRAARSNHGGAGVLYIVANPEKFGSNDRADWHDGQPVPEFLYTATVVDFRADGRELELIVAALNGDAGRLVRPADPEPENPPGGGVDLPRIVQLVPMQRPDGPASTPLIALDDRGACWALALRHSEAGPRWVWQQLSEFEPNMGQFR